jgi:hypothetical protein
MKISTCDRCLFYSHNPHLVCFLHPDGIEGKSCPDFKEDPNAAEEEIWAPEGYTFLGDDLVPINHDEG